MSQPTPHQPLNQYVHSNVNYLVHTGQKPVTDSSGADPLATRHTAEYEQHCVKICDARQIADLSLEHHGFVLQSHNTKVKDFYDEDEIHQVYYPEIDSLVREATGASRVLIFDFTLRAGDDATRQERSVRGPVQRVHNDYTEWSGPQRVRDLLPAAEAEELLSHRFAVVQIWRPIRNPVTRSPLAISDAQSIAPSDLIPAERRHPDRVGEIYHITFNPDHRWYYFPNMQRDEAILFKTYDSETDGRSRFTAHSAFDDPTTPSDALPRESIEVRTLAFWSELSTV